MTTWNISEKGHQMNHSTTTVWPEKVYIQYTDTGFVPQYFTVDIWDTVVFENVSHIPMWVASGPHPIHSDYKDFDALKAFLPWEVYEFTFDLGWTHSFHNHKKSLHNGVVRVSDPSIDTSGLAKTLSWSYETRDRLLAILDPQDSGSIRTLFDTIRNDPKIVNNCHDMAHDLGHRSYELYWFSTALTFHDIENAPINDIDDICAGGYMHGVLEEYFLYNPDTIQNPSSVCDSIPDENKGSCFHGVWHGIMFSMERDLQKSVEICRNIEWFEPEHRCYEGVYMELFWWQTFHAGWFLGWDTDDPLQICSTAPFDEQAACYLYSHLWYLRTHKHDYAWAIDLCLDTKDIDQYGESFCIKWVGITTMKSLENAWLQYTELYTKRLNTRQKWYYYDGMHGYAFLSWKNREELEEVCNKMKEDTEFCLLALSKK